MKKNPVGRAVGNVLKPVGPGRGTARPSVRTLNTIRQNQQSQMNSFEPEGEMTEGILGGAGLMDILDIQINQGNADCQQNEE